MDWETEKKSQTRRFWLGVFAGSLAAIFVLAGIWCVWQISGRTARGDFASGEISERDVEDKLDQINGLIERYYLYEDEIDEDALIDGIYSGYASALGDPYTEYYDKEETQALLETTSGEFSGIGATMSMNVDSGEITIVNVYKDSPADRALPFDDVVVASRARFVYLRIARLIGFVAFVLLFDGRNVRLVILFHVTN